MMHKKGDRSMFVGGEFYYDERWISETPTISTEGMVFLNGGKACLVLISDYLKDHGTGKILLPSYLCPTIVTTFDRCGLECEFYQVNQNLTIDLDDLSRKIEHLKAMFFINYFGFLHAPKVRNFIQDLRHSGVTVVEDNAQAGFHNHPTGDFIFNSLRKFSPYDGGYLITSKDISPYLQKYKGLSNRRLPVIRDYRSRLPDYLFAGMGSHTRLEKLFNLAEQYYDSDLVVEGDIKERRAIESLDWKAIKQVRRENYDYMLDLVSSIPEITPIFPVLQEDNMPLGLPVYFSNVDRDRVYAKLGEVGIGLTIHWDEICTYPQTRTNHLAVDMASRILTLAIDQRTSHKQMDYLALNLIEGIRAAKTAP
jgi:hypothetical protein